LASPTNDPRVALVTGGSRGIGRGIVERLAPLGLHLAVHYRSQAEAAEQTCAEALRRGAASAEPFAADLGRLEDGPALVDRVFDHFGRLDLLVNNAGVAPDRRADLLETAPESWDRVLGINLKGPFFLTQRAARRMIAARSTGALDTAAEAAEPPPMIVFVTSVSSVFASVNRPEYCVSKAGLSMVVQLFASRLAEEGILVYEIRPGIIRTDMTAGVAATYDQKIAEGLTPIRRWGTPEDVGRAVAAIAAGSLPFSTGEVIGVDGGMHLRRL